MREQRKLAAVLAADVVGYSRLMGRDEAGTLARLKEHRIQRLDLALATNGGRLVKLTGDGVLAEFGSAVDSLRAAIEFQQAVDQANTALPEEQRIVFRIGLHVGDLIVDGDDLYGDGVNIAARLEGQAEPGGIVVSGALHEAAAGKLEAKFVDLGRLSLKNIDRQVQAYRVEWNEPRQQRSAAVGGASPLPLPDKPSIAVLPFQNMSADPEQEYFVDGLVEEIITGLSRFKSLFVIARNSTFAYKGKSPDIRTVGRELGVRYVLEGSVRREGSRIRITGQLIDASNGAHLWADRFDGAVSNVFDCQDEVTERVVSAIAPRLEREEIARALRRPTDSIDAVTEFYAGLPAIHRPSTSEANDEALRHFYRAVAIDPSYATPYGYAALCLVTRRHYLWPGIEADDDAEVRRLAQCVRDLGTEDATALTAAGYALACNLGEFEAGDEMIQKARLANPNLAHGHMTSGIIKAWRGETDTAIADLTLAMRLSPRDLYLFASMSAMGLAHFNADRYDEAVLWYEKALRELVWPSGLKGLIASYFCVGRTEDACRMMADLRRIVPGLRISTYLSDESSGVLFRRPLTVSKFIESARFAGLPE